MKRAFIRSTLFNLAFYGWTAFGCVLFLPGLLLPRRLFTGIVRTWIEGVTFLEKVILHLRYEVRGAEYLPQSGAYICAAKHQSPYETIKLRVLFKDPAIVLKRELLSIPFWGWYLKKSDVIAIDRRTPDEAFASLERGAVRMRNAGRPIVIFPQGTRVWPHETPEDKPYRSGVARVQVGTGLPIIPMALNSGMFWPRNGWLKSPGTVVFQFLEPIPPGLEKQQIMDDLQSRIERASNNLRDEALQARPRKGGYGLLAGVLIIFAAYSGWWFFAARQISISYQQFMRDIGGPNRTYTPPRISGYPGPINVHIAEETVETKDGVLSVHNLNLRGWPVPFVPVLAVAQSINVKARKWETPLTMERLYAKVTYFNQFLTVHESSVQKDDFSAGLTGTVDLRAEPVPLVDMKVRLQNYQSFLMTLNQLGIIKTKDVFMSLAALSLFTQDGVATIPITQRGEMLYAGPLPVASLPTARRPDLHNPPVPDR